MFIYSILEQANNNYFNFVVDYNFAYFFSTIYTANCFQQ